MGNRFHDEDEYGFDPIDTLSDGVDAVGDVATSAWDRAGDVVKAVPGGAWTLQAVDDVISTGTRPMVNFIEGPLRDFARTGVGETIFRAFSVMLGTMLFLTPYVGFTLAFLTWSIPGLAKGEPFMQALTTEFAYRVDYVVSVFAGKALGNAANEGIKKGVNKLLSDQMQRAVNSIQEMANKAGVSTTTLLAKSGLSPSKLAQQLGIREDIASYAIEWFKGSNPKIFKLINQAYNPDGTIKAAVKKALETKMAYPAGSPCANLEALKAKGMTEENTRQIPAMNAMFRTTQALCEEWQLNEAIRVATNPDPNAGNTLGKRKILTAAQKAAAALLPKKTPVEVYQAAVKAGQKPVILAALKAKAEAWQKEEDARLAAAASQAQPPNTLAGGAAVAYTPSATVDSAVASANSESNKKSAITGAISGFVGAGGALLAGLSAGIAIPVGLGFAAGGAIATKLLTKPKVAAG